MGGKRSVLSRDLRIVSKLASLSSLLIIDNDSSLTLLSFAPLISRFLPFYDSVFDLRLAALDLGAFSLMAVLFAKLS